MPEENRRGTIVLRDERNSAHPGAKIVDIIQLKDTFKGQPRDNEGQFIHTAPDERIHVDVYFGPSRKGEVGVRLTDSAVVSGQLVSGTTVAMASGQVFGFAGSIVGSSGAIGTIQAVLQHSGLVLSSEDVVCGTIFVGSTIALSGSSSLASGL